MTPAFLKALKHTLGIEGGYSDHASDPGGKTNWGITEALARRHGYEGDMKDLPRSKAIEIYKSDFWDELRLDEVASHSDELAMELFDSAVNCGPGTPIKWLQKGLNFFNKQGQLWDDISEDGMSGANTIRALEAMHAKRGNESMKVLTVFCNSLQGAYYHTITERNEALEDFAYGWFSQRVV